MSPRVSLQRAVRNSHGLNILWAWLRREHILLREFREACGGQCCMPQFETSGRVKSEISAVEVNLIRLIWAHVIRGGEANWWIDKIMAANAFADDTFMSRRQSH